MSETDLNNKIYNNKIYGTTEPPQSLRKVQVGSLSFLYSQESLRRIAWCDEELVRGLVWPIRDENWGTYAPEIISEEIEDTGDKFVARLRFSVAGGRLSCDLNITAWTTGETEGETQDDTQGETRGAVRAELTMTPQNQPFDTNRAGFTVLHPIRGTVGQPLTVVHSNGESEQSEFPRLISPDQPIMDIQQLSHAVGDARVDIAFKGEVFEMEDQRNWSDASYKTYCVPLVFPFTYSINQAVKQSISVECSGGQRTDQNAEKQLLTVQPVDGVAPQIGLALERSWTGDAAQRTLAARAGASHLLIRVESEPDLGLLLDSANLCALSGAEIGAEIVLGDTEDITNGLRNAAEQFGESGLSPARILALRQSYLKSHQPAGPWPEGPTPVDVCQAARAVFPNAKIGGGMMTNFTELNRCPPDPEYCDYITHANTAIVHASDDLSVLETLETLPRIFASAAELSGGKPYRLGLVSIGMRSNPYGEDVAENPTQIRRTMAREDPRHRGLFGAAWATGVLAATEDSAVEALCLAAPIGPFGIVYAPQSYPQVGYDDQNFAVYPLFHVVRAASEMAGATRLSFDGLPDGVVAFGVQQDGTSRAMLANVTHHLQNITLAASAMVAVMDTLNFNIAVSDADWLDNAERQSVTQLDLEPFAVAFASWDG
ncbi:MAG: hypothetical protein KTR32_22540 [Granulosicoccus sp.]|nr:hypothetical protein [Granulosicoccus sp.]